MDTRGVFEVSGTRQGSHGCCKCAWRVRWYVDWVCRLSSGVANLRCHDAVKDVLGSRNYGAFKTSGLPLQMDSPTGRHASPTKLCGVHAKKHA